MFKTPMPIIARWITHNLRTTLANKRSRIGCGWQASEEQLNIVLHAAELTPVGFQRTTGQQKAIPCRLSADPTAPQMSVRMNRVGVALAVFAVSQRAYPPQSDRTDPATAALVCVGRALNSTIGQESRSSVVAKAVVTTLGQIRTVVATDPLQVNPPTQLVHTSIPNQATRRLPGNVVPAPVGAGTLGS